AALLMVILLEVNDLYQIQALLRPLQNLGRILLLWSATFALLAIAGFLLKSSGYFSRFLFATWFVSGLVLIVGLRMVLARMIRRWARNGRMERRAIIVGGGAAAETLIRSIE